MGVILRVRDKDFRRDLAMKVLRPDESAGDLHHDSQRSARFLEEAQVTGQLEHPGIVPVYEVGLDDLERLFFTMRLVRGEPLGEVIDRVHSTVKTDDEARTRTRVLDALLGVCVSLASSRTTRSPQLRDAWG